MKKEKAIILILLACLVSINIVFAQVSEKDKLEKICREKIIEFNLENLKGKPKELLKSLDRQKKEIRKEKKKIVSELRVFAKEQLDDLLALREEIYLERVRKEVSKNFVKTDSTFIIKGWVLEKDENTLQESLKTVSKKSHSLRSQTSI